MFQIYHFSPRVAMALKSAEKAFIIEYIGWSIKDKETRRPPAYDHCFYNGEFYMWDTYESWLVRMPWVGLSTIRKYMADLRNDSWIKTAFLSPDPRDRTLYYTLNKAKYNEVNFPPAQNEQSQPSAQSEQVPPAQNEQLEEPASDTCSTKTLTNTLSNTPPNPEASLSGERDHSHDITLYEGHPSLVKTSPQDEQKPTALALTSTSKAKPRASTKGLVSFAPDDLIIAKEWLEFALSQMKWKKAKDAWTPEKFAEAINKVRRATDINFDGLRALLDFIRKDEFWSQNALSPAGLLNKSANGNRKIDNILIRMKPKGQTKYEKALNAVAAMEREDQAKGKAKAGNDPF